LWYRHCDNMREQQQQQAAAAALVGYHRAAEYQQAAALAATHEARKTYRLKLKDGRTRPSTPRESMRIRCSILDARVRGG
jgi:hypothetical protein